MVKRQHYVPRCYLRNFADGKKEIWVYDKARDLFFPEKIKNVAYEEYFYDAPALEKAVCQEQFVEKALGKLENEAAKVIAGVIGKLNSNNFTCLLLGERQNLALFMAVQMERTREERIRMRQMCNKLSAWFHDYLTPEMKAACPENVPPLRISEQQLAELQGKMLTDPNLVVKYTNVLCSHFWIILKAHVGCRFLTSDHPFVRKANVDLPFGGLGIASKGIEICFPISPKYCLCLYERAHFAKRLCQFNHLENRVYQSKHPANMDYCNQFQVSQSTRFVFGEEEGDLKFAQQFCAENPQCRDPRAERFGQEGRRVRSRI